MKFARHYIHTLNFRLSLFSFSKTIFILARVITNVIFENHPFHFDMETYLYTTRKSLRGRCEESLPPIKAPYLDAGQPGHRQSTPPLPLQYANFRLPAIVDSKFGIFRTNPGRFGTDQ